MTWNRQKYRTVHNLCMICCVNVNVKYHHPMHLKLPWIHGSPIFTPAVLTSAKFPFLCEFCIILMERPRLNLRSQYWAIWPNLEASSRLGTEIMENSSWEVRPSLPSTRRGRFPGSQRQLFSFCSSKCSFEVKLVIWPKEVELNPRVRCAFGNVLLFRLKNFVVNSRQG